MRKRGSFEFVTLELFSQSGETMALRLNRVDQASWFGENYRNRGQEHCELHYESPH
jgi:hypothetical protein